MRGGRRGRMAVARVVAQWASAEWAGRGSENRAGKPAPTPILVLVLTSVLVLVLVMLLALVLKPVLKMVLKPGWSLAKPAANPAPRPKKA